MWEWTGIAVRGYMVEEGERGRLRLGEGIGGRDIGFFF